MKNRKLKIDRQTDVPIYRQLYERFRDAVHSGSLQSGDRIPSSRSLASELGVARGTIEEAYALLSAEGYLMRNGKRGSIISTHLPKLSKIRKARTSTKVEKTKSQFVRAISLSPFQLGVPALDLFPRKLWSRITSSQSRKFAASEMMYPDPLGYWPLREAIAQYLALSRGIQCLPDNVIVTDGYQGALDLVSNLILRPDDSVWLEDPGYFGAQQLIANSSAQVVPVPTDASGLCVQDGINLAPNAKLAIVTPSHHSPTCVTMPLSRRMELLSWANEQGSWIIEDDYDGEFHYSGKLLPTLKSLDTQNNVLYAGSFSKTLFPSLRLGYLVVPDKMLNEIEHSMLVRNSGVATLQQAVTAQFMTEGHFARHLKRMRTIYARRRIALTEALRRVFPDFLNISLQGGGMNVIAALPDNVRDVELVERVAKKGIQLQALSANSLKAQPHNALIFGFTNVPEKEAFKLCNQLKEAMGSMLPK